MRRPLAIGCLCLVMIVVFLHWGNFFSAEDSTTVFSEKEEMIVTGRVYQKESQKFYLDSILFQKSAADSQQTIPNSFSQNLICEFSKAENFRLGSTVTVKGNFQAFSSAANLGEFDQKKYYNTIDIGGKLVDVEILSVSNSFSLLKETLYQLRTYWKERLYLIFPEKEASVMCTMLLGDKNDLDKEIKALFQENGIVHILSISGLHITMIGMGIYKMLRRIGIPNQIAAVCGGIVLILYGIMTGMSVSASRAIGMYLLHMFALVVGRTYDMLTALSVVGAFMVISNTNYLENAGFLLSFSAVLGIGIVYPVFFENWRGGEFFGSKKKRKYQEEKKWKCLIINKMEKLGESVRQSFLASLSITLVTLPVLLWFYYEVPVYSVFLNLLVLPFMNIVMIFGIIAMLIPGLGIVGTIDCLILAWYEKLCSLFEKLPFHTWNPGKPKIWQVILYYFLLAGVLCMLTYALPKSDFLAKKKTERKIEKKNELKGKVGNIILAKILPVGIMIFAVLIFAIKIPAKTSVTLLSVGQGDCIFLETAEGVHYLFDCGSSSRKKIGEYVLKPFLKYKGVSYLDAVFVSHPDEDHCNGVLEALASGKDWGITIGELVLPEVCEENRQEQLGELLAAAEQAQQEKEVAVRFVAKGDKWKCGEITFSCLHPPQNTDIEDTNAYSECFFVEFGKEGYTMLLTGDVEEEGEELLLQELQKREIRDITVLKVAHHGSRNSTPEEILKQLQPKAAIISCGEGNRYGHPHKETLERLSEVESEVLVTKDSGAVMLDIGKKVKIYEFIK